MFLKTFKQGGIFPKTNKFASAVATQKLPLPSLVKIPLSNHIGAPSIPLVQINEYVKVGQLIAKADGFISANVHSSVSGKVLKIDSVISNAGIEQRAIYIEVIGDEWESTIDQSRDLIKECTFTSEEIKSKITEAGIVGLGGATFPTHVKLNIPETKKATTLIINGVECEPYLTCDHRLMLEHGEEILVGVSILMNAISVEKAIIGIEINKSDAIKHLKNLSKSYKGIQIIGLKMKYPQGGEKQLIEALTNKKVPSGGLPIDIGCVVQNVATSYAVYEAVQKNKPLVERILTITGKSVQSHGNFWARIGVPLTHIVEHTGGVPSDTGKIIIGGPMMGKALNTLESVVYKGTSSLLYIPTIESVLKTSSNCIKCSKCIVDCPMGLEPYLLMSQCENSNWDDMEQNRVLDCIDCGCCDYVCPSNRPLLFHIKRGKEEVVKNIKQRNTQKK
jgi:electron transport complex protein RnfC